jgi:hypothetical protein
LTGLLAGRAAAAEHQHTTAASHLATLRSLRVIVPVSVLAAATAVAGLFSVEHMPVPVIWWVVFGGALPAAAWWILEAACRSQHRAVLRAAVIRDAAWAAAARRREHLTAVDG